MAYVITEEQQLLQESAADVLKKAPVATVRQLRDSRDDKGFSHPLWDDIVQMGWPGIAASEELGGLDFGFRSLGLVMEEKGRSLSASPLLSVCLSSRILQKFGTDQQKEIVQKINAEGTVVACAVQEGDFYQPLDVRCAAIPEKEGYVISGQKDFVADAHVADYLLVSAHSDEGLMTVILNKEQAGVSVEKEFMMDSRYYSKVALDNVRIEKDDVVGSVGKGKEVLNDLTNVGNALLSAELLGLAMETFERTNEYLKERRQFDRPIGSFQALQHRAADLFGELEIAKSISIKALDALDEQDFMTPALCSMAKAKCVQVAQRATNEAIQMFGGIGMTDDEEIGFFLKRARVAAQQFGGYSYHLDRFARMSGY